MNTIVKNVRAFKYSILYCLWGFCVLFCSSSELFSADVVRFDIDLFDDKDSGIDRYWKLYKFHKAAHSKKKRVEYKKAYSIQLEIPENAKPIPIGNNTDFAGTTFAVKNLKKDLPLFVLSSSSININLSKNIIAKCDYAKESSINEGEVLLIIEDSTLWVKNRKGYNYGAVRKDILLLKDGKPLNHYVFPYTSIESKPFAKYVCSNDHQTEISNIKLVRDSMSTKKTFLFRIENQNNVYVHDVEITTPDSEMYGDRSIYVENSTNVTFKDIIINGTYSQERQYGYGISMNNVWNSVFVNISAKAKWGVFGNNNINTVRIEDSDINRFDIHCYGCDVDIHNTIFRHHYNQFSSIAGYITFNKCRFVDSRPLLIEDSYGSYTQFDLTFQDCIVEVDENYPYLISMGNSKIDLTARSEINKLEWPNIFIKNLRIVRNKPHRPYTVLFSKTQSEIHLSNTITIDYDSIQMNDTTYKIQFSNVEILSHDKNYNIDIKTE